MLLNDVRTVVNQANLKGAAVRERVATIPHTRAFRDITARRTMRFLLNDENKNDACVTRSSSRSSSSGSSSSRSS